MERTGDHGENVATERDSLMQAQVNRYVYLPLALVIASIAPAMAQTDPHTDPSLPPWHRGVSEEDKQKAQELFRQGFENHKVLLFDKARAKYEQALEHWDNPHLRIQLSKALVSIGLTLEAHQHLREALHWGPASMAAEDYQEARQLKLDLEKRLAVIEVRCQKPGIAVAMDGEPWFRGPGSGQRWVRPGQYVITAEGPGYFPIVKTVALIAGKRGRMVLRPNADRIVTERRWPRWTPWVVASAGVAMGVAGVLLERQSDRHFDEAERLFDEECNARPQCDVTSSGPYRRGQWEHRIAMGSLAVAGVTVATGLVMALLNRTRSYRIENRDDSTYQLVPAISGSTASLSVQGSF